MPRPALYSAAASRARCRPRRDDGPASEEEKPGCEPCCRSPTATGSSTLARELLALDVEVFATDGTREHLAADGIEVRAVSDLTGLPPLVGGQVKTFHPAIYAGILARRDVAAQLAELTEQGIGLIDIVVVNVKPFAPGGRGPARRRSTRRSR